MSDYQLVVMDETGQKQDVLSTPGETLWAEVGTVSVDRLGLPRYLGDEPAVYHLYNDDSGEALLPQQSVAEVVEEISDTFRVRLAVEMKPAR